MFYQSVEDLEKEKLQAQAEFAKRKNKNVVDVFKDVKMLVEEEKKSRQSNWRGRKAI